MATIRIFLVFLRLGLTSFGGPIAHLGFFHREFVTRKKWLSESAFGELVALCQVLPGPASSQVGIGIGLSRGGFAGAFAAWLGFTLPSAVLLTAFAIGIVRFAPDLNSAWVHGLKLSAVAVVAQALWSMSRRLCPDLARQALAVAVAMAALASASPFTQVALLLVCACAGGVLPTRSIPWTHAPNLGRVSPRAGWLALLGFFVLLFGLPLAARSGSHAVELFDRFFRAGSLVFGGGHVVLPLLKTEIVDTGWLNSDLFMAGYGAAQAIPGPLFTFSAFVGAASPLPPNGWIGATIALAGAFLPAFLLLFGVLPFWEQIRGHSRVQSALVYVNAGVVGLLLAAFYFPVCTTALAQPKDYAIALTGFVLLERFKTPSWLIVALTALASAALS